MLGKGVIVLTLVGIGSGDLKSEIGNGNEISLNKGEETYAFLAFLEKLSRELLS